eukprot:9028833-Pyramimonas_sp.AAC.2
MASGECPAYNDRLWKAGFQRKSLECLSRNGYGRYVSWGYADSKARTQECRWTAPLTLERSPRRRRRDKMGAK